MASDLSFVEFVRDQIRTSPPVTFRKMFGEYAIYHSGKVVALVCDNQLFVRPTAGGREVLGTVTEGAPYPGAKLHFLIADQLDDPALLARLVEVTARELPLPKPKRKRR